MKFFSTSLDVELKDFKNFIPDDDYFCTYGILRGTEKAIKNAQNYIYIDNGYFNGSTRNFIKEKGTRLFDMTGYYRVVCNDLVLNRSYKNYSPSRFNELNYELKDLSNNGEYIILSEPSKFIIQFYNLNNWVEETTNALKKYTDRKIIVHDKFSKIPLTELLKKAYAFVSYQSTAGYRAIMEGVPAYFTIDSLKIHGNIMNIEKRELNHQLLYLTANSQWKLREFFSDEFKEFIDKIKN